MYINISLVVFAVSSFLLTAIFLKLSTSTHGLPLTFSLAGLMEFEELWGMVGMLGNAVTSHGITPFLASRTKSTKRSRNVGHCDHCGWDREYHW